MIDILAIPAPLPLPKPPEAGPASRRPQHGSCSNPQPDPPRRAGLQHEHLPSRRGDLLVYRDGRTEPVPEHFRTRTQRPQRLSQWELEQIQQPAKAAA